MKRSRASAAAWTVLALAFSANEASAQKAAPMAGRCESVWVTAPDFGQRARRARKPFTFSAAEVLDLEFQVIVPAVSPRAELVLRVFTPNGHLYQELSPAPADPSPVASRSRRQPRYRTVTATLPVAGTTIVNNSLYGTWRVDAYFAGERTACTKPRAFAIKP